MAVNLVDSSSFVFTGENNDYERVFVGINGKDSTIKDLKEIPNMSSVSAKNNVETKEQSYYGEKGKRTKKSAVTPQLEVTFGYSDNSDVHNYLLEAGDATGDEGYTQVCAYRYDGKVINYIATVQTSNWGADGAKDDDATVTVTLAYAGGEINKFTKEEFETAISQ